MAVARRVIFKVEGDNFVEHGSPVAVVCLGFFVQNLQPICWQSKVDFDTLHSFSLDGRAGGVNILL